MPEDALPLGKITSALLLIVAANSTPWLLGHWLAQRWAWPVDGGSKLWDGERLFGAHKTWRGVFVGSLTCGLLAISLGLGFMRGMGFGALSLLGDALSSAIKRRLHLAPGREVPGLDQLPEALLPTWVFSYSLQLGWRDCLLVALVFAALDLSLTRLRHQGG